jgi:hypothetical protein
MFENVLNPEYWGSITFEWWIVIALGFIGFCWCLVGILTWLSRIGTLISIYDEYEKEYIHEGGPTWYFDNAESIMKKESRKYGKTMAENIIVKHNLKSKKVKK